MSTSVFLGRQPIFDTSRRTYAYELLYRNGAENLAFFRNPDDATRRVLEVAMLEWGFDRVVGDRFGFINAASGILHSGILDILPADRAVIELEPGVELDWATVEAIRAARGRGLRFALEGVTSIDVAGYADVAPFVDIVKVDVQSVPTAKLPRLVAGITATFPSALKLAAKVEEPSEFDETRELGFDLFQGYFFAKPEVMGRTERPANLAAAVQLMAEVNRPEVDLDRVEDLIATDPTLAYGLLRLVNSSSYGLTVHVQSIRHAIVLLGLAQVRHLAVLLTMATKAATVNEELIVLAATRAKMAASLAGDDAQMANNCLTAGLLSVIDAVFQSPMEELVGDLPLQADVRAALVDGSGPVGAVLAAVYAFERADAAALDRLRPDDAEHLRESFGDGAAWGEALRRELHPQR
ncbi:MAG: HDOD domain-containing protein [Acidimicrobiales bacterium]|nr:HDOD domain-containing protein [Acidimicrobiales bacterium]MCB9392746.1 HDOD domain-containing protein [Acidimicrobiaceae bacterium]